MYEEEEVKRKKKKKPGQWSIFDVILAIFGIIALIALTVAAFKGAQWAYKTFL